MTPTTRRARPIAQSSVPVLSHPDGSTIKLSEAMDDFGFQFFEVYASTLMINARYVGVHSMRARAAQRMQSKISAS